MSVFWREQILKRTVVLSALSQEVGDHLPARRFRLLLSPLVVREGSRVEKREDGVVVRQDKLRLQKFLISLHGRVFGNTSVQTGGVGKHFYASILCCPGGGLQQSHAPRSAWQEVRLHCKYCYFTLWQDILCVAGIISSPVQTSLQTAETKSQPAQLSNTEDLLSATQGLCASFSPHTLENHFVQGHAASWKTHWPPRRFQKQQRDWHWAVHVSAGDLQLSVTTTQKELELARQESYRGRGTRQIR